MVKNNQYLLLVLNPRKLILSLLLFFSLALTLNAFAHCIFEHNSPSPGGAEIPGFISCIEDETSPYLRPYNPGHDKARFAKMHKNVVGVSSVAFLQETGATTILRPSRSVFVPSSVPIYQRQTVYRI